MTSYFIISFILFYHTLVNITFYIVQIHDFIKRTIHDFIKRIVIHDFIKRIVIHDFIKRIVIHDFIKRIVLQFILVNVIIIKRMIERRSRNVKSMCRYRQKTFIR